MQKCDTLHYCTYKSSFSSLHLNTASVFVYISVSSREEWNFYANV